MTRSGDRKGKAAGPAFVISRKSAGGAGRAQKVNTGKYENTDRTDGYKRSASNHARKIALYHTLEKQIARTTGKERERLMAEQEKLGGLQVYQEASLRGARHGESSKWLMQQLENRRGRRKTRLLDVGAIAGTSYSKYSSVTPIYIDLNPNAPHVIKADFLKYPLPDQAFDVVCLSLVLNFVGAIEDRVEMLRRAQLFVHSRGYLYVVLPKACTMNSRFMDQGRMTNIFRTIGWRTVAQHNSAMLSHWLLRKCAPDNAKWPRKEVRAGIKRNNFVLIVKRDAET